VTPKNSSLQEIKLVYINEVHNIRDRQKIKLCTIKENQTEGSAGGGASPAVLDPDVSLVPTPTDMF
jgi:hypothetical protein